MEETLPSYSLLYVCYKGWLTVCLLSIRWPDLQDACDHQRSYSWQCLYQIRFRFRREVQQLLAGMSCRFHKREEISNSELCDFGKIMQEYEYGYAFMVNELMNVTYDDDV